MKGLNLIYHFHSFQGPAEDFRPASYRILYFFDEEGFVEPKVILDLLKAFPDSDFQEKTFMNLEDLKAFLLRVAEYLEVDQVRLISVQDYNIGIDGARDLKSYRELFSKYGEALINQQSAKKKGLFGKFFS